MKEALLHQPWQRKWLTLQGKSHDLGPPLSSAHSHKTEKTYAEFHKVLQENQIQFQRPNPVSLRVRCDNGVRIYESTEEVTEDLVCHAYTQ